MKKMNLYFGNMSDLTLIGECDESTLYSMISDQLEKVNYKSYYYRRFRKTPNIETIDFGSHNYFFYIVYEEVE